MPASRSRAIVDADRLRQALTETLTIIESLGGDEPADRGVDQLVGVVKEAEQQLLGITGGRLSLRWLVPAAFVSLGVRQLLLEGLTIGAVPWYVLLYYGVDSFLKLYPEHGPAGEAGIAAR